MPRTQFSPSIPSRPVYDAFTSKGPVPALMFVCGKGAEAALDLAALDAASMEKAHLIYAAEGENLEAELKALNPMLFYTAPSVASAMPQYRRALNQAHVGVQIYLAGTEGFIGQAQAEALAAGVPLRSIQTDHRGSIARRMQCVHCKGIAENVTTDPYICPHCGLTLFVRDHYSRRLAAFQGVCVDAETPGVIPRTEELKP